MTNKLDSNGSFLKINFNDPFPNSPEGGFFLVFSSLSIADPIW